MYLTSEISSDRIPSISQILYSPRQVLCSSVKFNFYVGTKSQNSVHSALEWYIEGRNTQKKKKKKKIPFERYNECCRGTSGGLRNT